MNKHKIFLAIFTLLLFGCQEDRLEVALGEYQQRLVIDGSIEQDKFPIVALTFSSPYLKNIERDDLIRASVLNAKVTVSDGTISEVLILRRNTNGFPESIYRGSVIKGKVGHTYNLKIELDNEVYTASTTIPTLKPLDSLWYEPDATQPSKLFLKGRISDDLETEDYYRIFTKRIGKDKKFIPMYLSTIADTFFEGKTLNFTIFRGVQNLNETRDDGVFALGDSVQVRFSKIDKDHFSFWSTAEKEIYSFSNPFSSSGNEIIYNVDNNAIGIWGGYASTYSHLRLVRN